MHERRRILLALLAGGAVSQSTLPEKWSRPVVRSVLLPAHAQTTGPDSEPDPDPTIDVWCEIRVNEAEGQLIPEGSSLFIGETLVIVFTVTPNPGAGLPGTIEERCDGSTTNGPNAIVTDANGRYEYHVESGDPCGGTGNAAVRATFSGVSDTCSWIATDD